MPLRIVIDVRHVKDFGIGTYIRNLVRSLGEIDQVNHYFLTASPGEVNEFAQLPSNFETVVYHPASPRFFNNIHYPTFVKNLAPSLVHIPLNQVPLLLRKPYVVTIHDMSSFLFGGGSGIREDLRLYHFRRGLIRADRVIAVSAATRRDVESILGIPGRRIRLVYSAPDPRFLEHSPSAVARAAGAHAWEFEQKRLMERYQIHYPFILYAGRIRPHKNVPRLIEAFAVVRGELDKHPEYKDLRLIIIGDEISKHPEVRRAVIQTRVENAVRFLGFVPFDTLRVFYSTAELFVFPSLYEGFGLPPLEAMASGTPVVTSKVSSLPEVVGDAAMTVNPEIVFDIARGIRDVLIDRDLRSRLIQAGYNQARSFSWRRTAEQVLDVYRDAARSN
jgi:glycosyltransferase involved in cell wall biosynthesis